MADLYTQLVRSPIGRPIARNLGLPEPPALERYDGDPTGPVVAGPVLLGGPEGGRLLAPAARLLAAVAAEVHTPLADGVRRAAADAGLDAPVFNPAAPSGDERFKALVFDASGIASPEELDELHAFFSPTIARVRPSGRVIVLGTPPQDAAGVRAGIAQRALEGFTRSVAKELRGGATAQLVYVAPGGEDALDATLRFLLSPRSAFVSGQVIRVAAPVGPTPPDLDWARPLAGDVALVTGASRGIGAAIAHTLARDGAHVVALDIPALEDDLRVVADEIGGSYLTADVTAATAPADIAAHVAAGHGGVDVVVHNAGITRDKSLARMSADQWNGVLAVNLVAAERITAALLDAEQGLRQGGRIVGVSSMNGIAGNAGQTNYATSKAGVIGLVEGLAPGLAERGCTINAVAPGFIETQMTATMPFMIREAGRRMSSLRQSGLPEDVAETIAWLAGRGSLGLNGNVVRVDGQHLLGA